MNFVAIKSGTSVEGDEIKAFRSERKAKTYVYLMAGVHGDEVEGVYFLDKLFEWLKELDELEESLVVLPILNVDGYRTGSRTNAHGVDLNRNLPSSQWEEEARSDKYNPGPKALSEPENQFLDQLFQKYPPHLIVSFHSWKPFINFNGECRVQAEYLSQINHYQVIGDIEDHPTPGSLGEYGPEKYQAPVLTIEFPLISDDKTLHDIWLDNELAFKSLLKSELIKKNVR